MKVAYPACGAAAWPADRLPAYEGGGQRDPATVALLARMSPAPDAGRAALIDVTVKRLKAAGIWDRLDLLHMYWNAEEQWSLLNWIKDAHDGVATNSPLFTTDRGFTGDGATSYIDLGYNPSTQAVNYGQNDGSLSAWQLDPNGTAQALIGQPSATSAISLQPRSPSNATNHRINTNTLLTASFSGDPRGFWIVNRTSASAAAAYQNGVLVVSSSSYTSSAPPNISLVALRQQTAFSIAQIAAVSIGASLSAEQRGAMQAILTLWGQQVGAI